MADPDRAKRNSQHFSHDASEVTMATDTKPLRDQIADASRELKLARRDGSAEWIGKAAAALDALIDKIPRSAQHSPTGTAQ